MMAIRDVYKRQQFINVKPGDAEYTEYWGSFLKDFSRHLRKKGWFEKTAISMDEQMCIRDRYCTSVPVLRRYVLRTEVSGSCPTSDMPADYLYQDNA